MRFARWTVALALLTLVASVWAAGPAQAQPTPEEVQAATALGVAWLAGQQNPGGYWGWTEECAVTALVVKKLEHHAVDPRYGLGLPSPFVEEYAYRDHIIRGYDWLFANCVVRVPIDAQVAGDPDTDGDGVGIAFGPMVHHRSYHTGIALMALCEAVELDRLVETGPLAGWTYEDVARDVMDYLSWSQMDSMMGDNRGGWGYAGCDDGVLEQGWDRSDNSNAGWVTLGLGFAQASWPEGCGFTVPQFVKDELSFWIDYIQTDVTGTPEDGGSGYEFPGSWVNILKTGNLLQQMALVGDAVGAPRMLDAMDYMERHWYDPSADPGWLGWPGTNADYHATFTAMKGFTSFDIHEFGDPAIDWQADFETVLLAEQLPDGSWPPTSAGWDIVPPILSTTWALLTLQKAAPVVREPVPFDVKPTSCPNPLNTNSGGVLPAAILGTEDFDVAAIDPTTLQLVGTVAPLRWAYEDVATPYEPYLGKEGAYACTEEGADGYLDMTLKLDKKEVVAALEAALGRPVIDGEVLVLEIEGATFDGLLLRGEDVVIIRAKK